MEEINFKIDKNKRKKEEPINVDDVLDHALVTTILYYWNQNK